MNDFPKQLRLFSIGFDVLDLVDILKKYSVPQKTAIACINFYCGRKIND